MNFIILFRRNHFTKHERHKTSIVIFVLLIENFDHCKIKNINFYMNFFFEIIMNKNENRDKNITKMTINQFRRFKSHKRI